MHYNLGYPVCQYNLSIGSSLCYWERSRAARRRMRPPIGPGSPSDRWRAVFVGPCCPGVSRTRPSSDRSATLRPWVAERPVEGRVRDTIAIERYRQLRNHTAISADIAHLWPSRTCAIIIPAKARDYVFTGVGLSVCLFVCYHDN